MDNRALSTVVEKLLSMGLVLLYIGLVTTTLYGGTVPAYQSAVGAELGDRTLAEATARVEQAVPPDARVVSATVRVSLPETIDGAGYSIRTDGDALVLDHPSPEIGGRTQPLLPDRVDTFEGEWQSGSPTVVAVSGTQGSVTVTLEAER
ncbi:hypothetical protein SAMN05443574_103184 [Haloarcula vallismortis]|uniref:Uncharacterized protein n=2 Tax=Haloarcula vallismortis TaxID=28442 RepID=M0JQS5_HALVA|nr:hypothetical protein [Haloarcula vallismortis]EMA11482.1 hypothetical protein C437_01180 [Haloarcula vallismortis ATCC 29715]SDW42656.1 hypothetical protein SAMN05443574_103184 [Haloarcula vallismortis]